MNLFDINRIARLTQAQGGDSYVQPPIVYVLEDRKLDTTGEPATRAFTYEGELWFAGSADENLSKLIVNSGADSLVALKRFEKSGGGGVVIIGPYVPSTVEDMKQGELQDGTKPSPVCLIRSQFEDWLVNGTAEEVVNRLKSKIAATIQQG